MKFIEKFFKHELAIDLGTANTLIYDPDKGVLLNQPSVIAIDKYDGDVLCRASGLETIGPRTPWH